MGKILGSWSGMRKYLEQDMLAASLQGRIRYGCTRYVGMDTCHIFEVCINGEQVKRFSWETVNTYFIDNGYTSNKNPSGIAEYWVEFWPLLDKIGVNSFPRKAFHLFAVNTNLEDVAPVHPNIRSTAISNSSS